MEVYEFSDYRFYRKLIDKPTRGQGGSEDFLIRTWGFHNAAAACSTAFLLHHAHLGFVQNVSGVFLQGHSSRFMHIHQAAILYYFWGS